MSKKEKGLLSLLLIGVLGAVAGMGVFGVFTSTTENTDNEFSAGSVQLEDNDANSSMYNVTGQKPGDTVTRCIRVTYTGTLPAEVRLYTTTAAASLGELAPFVNLTVTPGTAPVGTTFPNCTGFAADGAALYTGTLLNFAQTRNSYAAGIPDFPGAGTSWAQTDSVVYQFTVQLDPSAPDTAQGDSSGLHAYTWEARNQ